MQIFVRFLHPSFKNSPTLNLFKSASKSFFLCKRAQQGHRSRRLEQEIITCTSSKRAWLNNIQLVAQMMMRKTCYKQTRRIFQLINFQLAAIHLKHRRTSVEAVSQQNERSRSSTSAPQFFSSNLPSLSFPHFSHLGRLWASLCIVAEDSLNFPSKKKSPRRYKMQLQTKTRHKSKIISHVFWIG